MKLQIAVQTHEGMVRDHNEDNFAVCPDLNQPQQWGLTPKEPNKIYEPGQMGSLLVAADGMGGMNAGEVASQIAVDSVKEYFGRSQGVSVDQVPDFMIQACLYANEQIVKYGKENPESAGMGTTLILAWLREDMVHVCWVGDSRAYILRSGEEATLKPISKDHSLVQQWIDKGELDEEQAFYHPKNNIVTQSLGDSSNVPSPDYQRHKLKTGDRVLLCSDGLNGMLQDYEIKNLMLELGGDSLRNMSEQLVKAANDKGGHDNITVVLAYMSAADGQLQSITPNAAAVSATPLRRTNLLWGVALGIVLAIGSVFFVGKKFMNFFPEGEVKEQEFPTPFQNQKTELFGYEDEGKNEVISAIYVYAQEFDKDGQAKVVKENGDTAIINEQGKEIDLRPKQPEKSGKEAKKNNQETEAKAPPSSSTNNPSGENAEEETQRTTPAEETNNTPQEANSSNSLSRVQNTFKEIKKNTDGKFGVQDKLSGEYIIPFKFDTIYKKEDVFIAVIDGKKVKFDYRGKEVVGTNIKE